MYGIYWWSSSGLRLYAMYMLVPGCRQSQSADWDVPICRLRRSHFQSADWDVQSADWDIFPTNLQIATVLHGLNLQTMSQSADCDVSMCRLRLVHGLNLQTGRNLQIATSQSAECAMAQISVCRLRHTWHTKVKIVSICRLRPHSQSADWVCVASQSADWVCAASRSTEYTI